MQPHAKIVADSIGPDGSRLTSVQATGHRFILSEMNTHRALNKNSASSRAIPFSKQVARILDDPAIPVVFPIEQKGMSGGAPIAESSKAESLWLEARDEAVSKAQELAELGVHKSVVNRLLEPWGVHTMLISGTSFQNFFDLRCHPMAQPEIRAMAEAIRDAMADSQPVALDEGEWHLPYITQEDFEGASLDIDLRKISAGRCARLSYLTQEGIRDLSEDIRLFETLAGNGHWSPMEHVATPWIINRQNQRPLSWDHAGGISVGTDHLPKIGNLVGWRTLRVEEEARRGVHTYR